jgi:hypothetical protein
VALALVEQGEVNMAREEAKQERKWEPMRLTLLGKVGDVVRGGVGKTSTMPADPGEMRKPKPPNPEH